MSQVRSGQYDVHRQYLHHLLEVGPAGGATAAVAPCLLCRIEPPPVRQAAYGRAVRTAAVLAPAVSALEADAPAELAPMWDKGRRVLAGSMAASRSLTDAGPWCETQALAQERAIPRRRLHTDPPACVQPCNEYLRNRSGLRRNLS